MIGKNYNKSLLWCYIYTAASTVICDCERQLQPQRSKMVSELLVKRHAEAMNLGSAMTAAGFSSGNGQLMNATHVHYYP